MWSARFPSLLLLPTQSLIHAMVECSSDTTAQRRLSKPTKQRRNRAAARDSRARRHAARHGATSQMVGLSSRSCMRTRAEREEGGRQAAMRCDALRAKAIRADSSGLALHSFAIDRRCTLPLPPRSIALTTTRVSDEGGRVRREALSTIIAAHPTAATGTRPLGALALVGAIAAPLTDLLLLLLRCLSSPALPLLQPWAHSSTNRTRGNSCRMDRSSFQRWTTKRPQADPPAPLLRPPPI